MYLFKRYIRWGFILIAWLTILYIYISYINKIPDISVDIDDSIILYPIHINDRWGYIDVIGNVIIEPYFINASLFVDGVAAVALVSKPLSFWHRIMPRVYKILDGHSGLLKGSYHYLSTFSNELQPAQEFSLLRWFGLRNQLYGYIDKNGVWAIRPRFRNARAFSEGLAAVALNEELRGFINTKGDVVILSTNYIDIDDFSDGLSWVLEASSNKWGAINTQGDWVVVPIFAHKPTPFYSGVAAVPIEEGGWGLYERRTGKIFVEGFDKINRFSEGYASALEKGKYGFIDLNGFWIVPPQFDRVRDFAEGLACVYADGEFFYINANGEIIIANNLFQAKSFEYGLARVNVRSKHRVPGEFDYIDKKGNLVFSVEEFRNSRKWGLKWGHP